MIHIFLNGFAASAGAGLTYLHNVVPHLSAIGNVHTTVAVQTQLRKSFKNLPRVEVICPQGDFGTARRFWFEQRLLPALIRKSGADVLISAGNFALRNSPVPQILLSGNSLYTSRDFYRDLWRRREFGMFADNFVKGIFARKSVHWADCTIAPSQAFADELRRWSGKQVEVVHHGFDWEMFSADAESLPDEIQRKLCESEGCLRLLFVSHYNYYRNFETLIRALPLIQKRIQDRKVQLFLTCKLESGANPGAYNPAQARQLVRDLDVGGHLVELGTVPYRSLHQLYRACDIYVTASYAETFAHPLVEAMASDLPIVASDIPVHREICGDAARYFLKFSAEALAETVAEIAGSGSLYQEMSRISKERSVHFSWAEHVQQLLVLISQLHTRRDLERIPIDGLVRALSLPE